MRSDATAGRGVTLSPQQTIGKPGTWKSTAAGHTPGRTASAARGRQFSTRLCRATSRPCCPRRTTARRWPHRADPLTAAAHRARGRPGAAAAAPPAALLRRARAECGADGTGLARGSAGATSGVGERFLKAAAGVESPLSQGHRRSRRPASRMDGVHKAGQYLEGWVWISDPSSAISPQRRHRGILDRTACYTWLLANGCDAG